MKIGVAYEKRDWGAGRRTWRRTLKLYARYSKQAAGLSEYAIRLMSNREAKRLQVGPR